ncbi:hypothetical protein BC567DRAFT_42459 [Phyllosticta citribraziliensis]
MTWDQSFPGGDYDAVARRKASGAPAGVAPAAAPSTARRPAAFGNTGATRALLYKVRASAESTGTILRCFATCAFAIWDIQTRRISILTTSDGCRTSAKNSLQFSRQQEQP